MLRIFQNIRPVSALYILVLGALLRVPAIIYGPGQADYAFDPAILRGFFSLVNQNYTVSVIIGLLVIFLQAIWFNRLCIDQDVIYTHSYLPGYFFMIINSVFPESLVFNPVMLMNFCMIAALTYLYRLHHSSGSAVLLYYAALFMGLASLVLPVFYTGVVFLVIGTMVFKNINIKDLLGILLGYVFAGMVAAGTYFIAGTQYKFPKINYNLNLSFGSDTDSYLATGIVLVMAAAGLIKTFINYSKNNIKTRRISLLMSVYLAFATILILSNSAEYKLLFPLLSVSTSIMIAYFLIGKKQRRIKELLHYGLLLAVIWSLYGNHIHLF